MDKQYRSCKTLTEQSILIFLSWDYMLVTADVSRKQITVYDCLKGRDYRTTKAEQSAVQLVKAFLIDYVDNYGQTLFLTDHWSEKAGECVKGPLNVLGLNTLRTLDQLTQLKNPISMSGTEDPENESEYEKRIAEMGQFYTVELMSGTLLNF